MKWHVFYTTNYDCRLREEFDNKEGAEEFINSGKWEKDGEHVDAVIYGVLYRLEEFERVKAYKIVEVKQ